VCKIEHTPPAARVIMRLDGFVGAGVVPSDPNRITKPSKRHARSVPKERHQRGHSEPEGRKPIEDRE